jgi:hypothetical protein
MFAVTTRRIPRAASSVLSPRGPATVSTAARAASCEIFIWPLSRYSGFSDCRTTLASVTVGSVPWP